MAKKVDMGENVSLLIKETSAYEIIGRDAETACFKIYHDQSIPKHIREAAKLKVIQSNLRFALQFAMDYHRITSIPVEDFYADAKLGLMEAFYRYDYTLGVKFGSFAVWYMRTRMGGTVQENDLVRVPVRLRKKVLDALRKGKPVDTIRYGKEAEASIMHTFSMDLPVDTDDDDGGAITVGESIQDTDPSKMPDYRYGMELLRERVNSELKVTLTPDERKLLRCMFGLDGEESSLEEAAVEFGTSKEWARHTKAKALAKLREAHGLDDFTDGIH